MGKYDVPLDMTERDSAAALLDMIKPNADILEFGSANGRMTKYMTQELTCNVHILEIDKASYNDAIQYAVSGFFGDIESYKWKKTFDGMKFDYIIFADVLEHLRDPQKALHTVKDYLKDDGKILISVPNIAHDSIIINLLNDKFQYNDTGLLDSTHIHFFTHQSLTDMLSLCGLGIVEETAIYVEPESTEFCNNWLMAGAILQKKPTTRQYGNVYQFILSCAKQEYINNTDAGAFCVDDLSDVSPFISQVNVYIQNDMPFSEDNKVKVNLFQNTPAVLDLSKFDNITALRVDVLEIPCLIHVREILLDDASLDPKNLKGNFSEKEENDYLFLNQDPWFLIDDLSTSPQKITINVQVEQAYLGDMLVEHIQNLTEKNRSLLNQAATTQTTCQTLSKEIEALISKLDSFLETNQTLSNDLSLLHGKNEALLLELNAASHANQALVNELAEVTHTNQSLLHEMDVVRLSNKNLMVERTSAYNNIEELRREVNQWHTNYSIAITSRDEMASAYHAISHSTFWKLTKPLRICIDSLKNILRRVPGIRLFYRGLYSIRHNGLRETVNKVKSYRNR